MESMKGIKFSGKLVRTGGSRAVVVPKAIALNLDQNKKYEYLIVGVANETTD